MEYDKDLPTSGQFKNKEGSCNEDDLANIDQWNEPILLPDDPYLHPWPENVFPEPFNSFVKELARSVEVPVELPAGLLLSIIATCAQTKFQVRVKRDYHEPLVFWSLIVLPPSSRKSTIFCEITNPLRIWEKEQRLRVEEDVKSAKSKEATLKEMIKAKRTALARSNKIEFIEGQNEIEQLESKIPKIPALPQLWTTDVTPEHLGVIMKENNEAMGLLSDEGGVFDVLAGLYSGGKANLDIFLQGHSGGSSRVDRNSREQIDLTRTLLTIGLTVQPEVLQRILKNKTFRGRGLLGRFCFVYPPSNIGKRKLDALSMKEELRTEFHQKVREILNYCKCNNLEGEEVHSLFFSDEAYKKWLEYAQTIEVMMGELEVLVHITDWAGKLAGNIARIAGILHIMRFRRNAPEKIPIGIEDMKSAVKIGHCLINHALKVFDMSNLESPEQKSKAVFYWFYNQGIRKFTSHEFLRAKRGFDKKTFEEGAKILIENEIIKKNKSSKTGKGRPSEVYYVNPYIWDKKDRKDKKN